MNNKTGGGVIQLNTTNKESNGTQPFQQNRVYDTSGEVPSLMSQMSCGTHAILVKSNTEKGYDEANVGDTINFSMQNSKTRRGRVGVGVGVGVGVAQTLDTQVNQAVVLSHYGHKDKDCVTSDDCPTLKASSHGHEPMTYSGGRIRRLTEIETERLQGFKDDWTKYGIYEKQVWINKKEKTFKIVEGVQEISRTQRYKLCGNAVSVHIVQAITDKLEF